eukprot:7272149-Alexandrium_andersonii.AAC.1
MQHFGCPPMRPWFTGRDTHRIAGPSGPSVLCTQSSLGSQGPNWPNGPNCPLRGSVLRPVSYTHLTLPTICSV